jgi:hypothetical protein
MNEQLVHDQPTGLGAAMAGGNPKAKRAARDFYPTPANVTQPLLDREIHRIRSFNAPVWEPCAGDGAMLRVLAQYGLEVIGSDIKPLADDIDQANFFACLSMRAPVIITNPPFALAEDFINHALSNCRTKYLALLLKSSFWHAAQRISLWQRFPPTTKYELTWRVDFQNRGAPVMEVAWFIWDHSKKHSGCDLQLLYRPTLNQQETFL